MKFKTIAAALIIAGLNTAVLAQSSSIKTNSTWEFYGRAHMSFDKLDDGVAYQKQALSNNSSRLGFKGEKQFGDVKGIWQIEQEKYLLKNSKESKVELISRLESELSVAIIEGNSQKKISLEKMIKRFKSK